MAYNFKHTLLGGGKMMSYSKTTWYLVFALILFIGCAPQHTDNTETARAGIVATSAQWMAAFDQGDAAGVAACYTEDAQLLPPNSEVVNGQAGVQAFFQSLIDAGIKVKLEAVEVEGHGDTAFEVGNATVLGTDGQTIDNSKYIVVWKMAGDKWKLHRDIWNSNMPLPNSEASE